MLDFGSVLTILISTEFNVVALPFCKPYCFESEIPYCPQLKVPLLVFEKPLEHVLSGSNSGLVALLLTTAWSHQRLNRASHFREIRGRRGFPFVALCSQLGLSFTGAVRIKNIQLREP